jgi:hypothetical protein
VRADGRVGVLDTEKERFCHIRSALDQIEEPIIRARRVAERIESDDKVLSGTTGYMWEDV